MKYTVWDIETTTHSEYKRKASPFSAENRVVAQGFSAGTVGGQPLRAEGEYYGRGPLPADWFTRHLQGTRVLVGHNIKFDLLYALANPNSYPTTNLPAWMEWVARGGMVWDTQLAEYLLRGMEQTAHMLALDEVAPVYGGNSKFDEVKALWADGVDTHDIPEDLLMRYLLGGQDETGDWCHGDIGNTERVFLAQWAKAKESGQLRSILLNMGALLFTVEAERNGMFVDKDLGFKLAGELKARLDAALVDLNQYLPADLPFAFNWGSRHHKSALIFGGAVSYAGRVPVKGEDGQPVYYLKDETHYLLNDGTTTAAAPTDATIAAYTLYAGGKNKGEPKTKKVRVPDMERGAKTRLETLEYSFDGFTPPDPKWASSTPGVYSTAEAVIKELGSRNIPFLQTLSEVQAMSKDLGTYFITTDEEGNSKGMLTLVQPDGLIHHSLNHTATVTGRLSSSNPNLQNLSKGQKSEVKTLFRSRFGEGGRIIQSDFSSLEVYIQAILTECPQLVEDLASGKDMHCVRLAAKEKMPYEEVYRLCKVENDPEWDYKRTKAKVFSFQRAYGAGVAKIAESTGMTQEEVQALVDAENARYPEIDAFYERLTQTIAANRQPTHRVVNHPEKRGLTVQLGRSHSTTPDGKRYVYWEQPAPAWLLDKGKLAAFSPTEIRNYVVQGEGGEWAKAAMWLSIRAFYHYRNFDGQALLVNQVHDAEYVDCAGSVATKAAALLHVCMEEASTFMQWWFKWDFPIHVPSDTVQGENMMQETPIADPVFGKAVAALKPWLRKQFIGGHVPSWETTELTQ